MIGMIVDCNETIFFYKKDMKSDLYISNMDELAYWQMFV